MMSRGKFSNFNCLEVRQSFNDVLRVCSDLLFYGVYD